MKEKLQEYALIAEIIGGFAIVASLIFVGLQTGQNTKAVEANLRQSALEADNELIILNINNPKITMLRSKQDLTEEEAVILTNQLLLTFRLRENDYSQYLNGATDEETWLRYRSSIYVTFQWQNNRNWWSKVGKLFFSPNFVQEVDKILEETPVIQNMTVGESNLELFSSP